MAHADRKLRKALWSCGPLWMLLGAMLGGQAMAASIDYDPRRNAALRRCDDLQHRGRAEEARNCYRPLLRDVSVLVRAEAALGLGDLRNANDLFRIAVATEDRAVLPRLRWGQMFLEAGQTADALRLFQEALELDGKDVRVLLALARMGEAPFDEEDAVEKITRLLADNADLVESQLLAATMALGRSRYDDAARAAQRVVQLAQQQKLPPLEAHGLLAAIELLRNRDPGQWTRAALAYNPRYGAVFEMLGRVEVRRYRYKEADPWLQRAVEVQPDLWSGQRELGMNLMRLGRIEDARPHLEAAYEGDPFSITTVNVLRLIDTLAKFDVSKVAQPPMVLQLHKSESATLGPYLSQLAGDAITTFTRRYGYQPSGPVTVEVYPNHDDFTVRAAGLPGIGWLGVTFGELVVMDSPSGRKSGEFHWGSTLWHEMAHVFTGSLTKHRLPRWLTEGLSVYEEWTTGPTPGVSITPALLDTFLEGKLLPVVNLSDGFERPTYEEQVQRSYEQAGLVCLFAAQRWGFPRLVEFLRAFNETTNSNTDAAVRSVFKVTPEEFDQDFQRFVRERFRTYLADPKRLKDLMTRAHTMLEARNWAAAREAAQAAIEVLPEITAGGGAYAMLAAAEEGAGKPEAAIAALQSWRKAGGWDPPGLRKLGTLLLAAKRNAEATEVLAALNYVDPLAIDGHDRLGQLLLEQNRGAEALREYRVLLALQPLDTASANYGMARAYYQTGDRANARRHLLLSLDTAPSFRPAQKLLLEMTGDRKP